MDNQENRQAALEKALKEIEKSYGKGAVMKLGRRPMSKLKPFRAAILLLI